MCSAAAEAAGTPLPAHGSDAVVDAMVDAGRIGRKDGAGFYDYDENGKRTQLWPGLREHFKSGTTEIPLEDMKERMLFAESLETVKCFDEGVLTSVEDANIGSIFGIGFPAWTGGIHRFVDQIGREAFTKRANELADKHGERFRIPAGW